MRWSLGYILACLSLQEKSQPASPAHPFSAWSPLANFWSPASKTTSKIPRPCICLSPNSQFTAKISRWFKKQSQVCGFVCLSPSKGPYKVSSPGFVELTFASNKQSSTDKRSLSTLSLQGGKRKRKLTEKWISFVPSHSLGGLGSDHNGIQKSSYNLWNTPNWHLAFTNAREGRVLSDKTEVQSSASANSGSNPKPRGRPSTCEEAKICGL